MNEITKNGVKLFVRTIFINIMCFFVVMSLISFSVAAFAEEVGYVAYGVKENSEEVVELYKHYDKDGKDTKFEEFKKQGYTIEKKNIREVDKTGDAIILSVAQLFALGILASFVYPTIWDLGNGDCNMVKFEHKKEDKLKGLKIGIIAAIPSAVFYLTIAVGKSTYSKNLTPALYKLVNSAFYPAIEFIVKDAKTFSDLGIGQILLLAIPVFAVPVTAHIAYTLGYKNISIGENLTYKKQK